MKKEYDFWHRHYRLKLLKESIENIYYRINKMKLKIDLKEVDLDSMPIVIINFNRFKPFVGLYNWIKQLVGKKVIFVLDNNSTYIPLLKYYERIEKECFIIRFKKNYGLRKLLPIVCALEGFKKIVVTDSDLLPYQGTPKDILDKMGYYLDKYPNYNHIGASLEIMDIPDYYPLKDKVISWESQFWENKLNEEVFVADVDTTFSMYRNTSNVLKKKPSLRLNRPYTLKHVDWYIKPDSISREYRNYLVRCKPLATYANLIKSSIGVGTRLSPLSLYLVGWIQNGLY